MFFHKCFSTHFICLYVSLYGKLFFLDKENLTGEIWGPYRYINEQVFVVEKPGCKTSFWTRLIICMVNEKMFWSIFLLYKLAIILIKRQLLGTFACLSIACIYFQGLFKWPRDITNEISGKIILMYWNKSCLMIQQNSIVFLELDYSVCKLRPVSNVEFCMHWMQFKQCIMRKPI